MTFYPGEREKYLMATAWRLLVNSNRTASLTYDLSVIEDWADNGKKPGGIRRPGRDYPQTPEESEWLWAEIEKIEKQFPQLIRRPEPEPEIMLQYDEVTV